MERNRAFSNEILWLKILAFELDEPSSQLTFSGRLARENGWKLNYTLRVIHEYKKFMYLICIADFALTPSDEVDQAWHLHLLYTRSYWDEFCIEILDRKIHHGPTKGGESESIMYEDMYEKTKVLYANEFGHTPPEDIWPSSEKRFSEINFQRVSLDRFRLVKKLFRK
jgi:hypothetical protein